MSLEIVIWDHKRQEYTISNTAFSSQTCGTPDGNRGTARRMTLKPHAPIFNPKNCSRLFAKYRLELLIEMDASTSQDVADLSFQLNALKLLPLPIAPQFRNNFIYRPPELTNLD